MKSNSKSSFTNIKGVELYDLTYKSHVQFKLTNIQKKTIMFLNK